MSNFFDGLRAYGKALQIIGLLGLWGYVLIPALLSILVAIALLGVAWSLSADVGHWLLGLIPWLKDEGVSGWIARLLSALLMLSVGLAMFKQIVMALSSPFMSFLSEKVERYLAGEAYQELRFSVPQALSDMWRGIRISLRNLVRELLFTVLILLLGLMPILGLLAPVLLFAVQAYYAGFGNIDYTLERHFRVRDSVRFVRRHRALALGNGTVFMLLLFTGVGFLVALPLSTVAATVETVKRLSYRAPQLV